MAGRWVLWFCQVKHLFGTFTDVHTTYQSVIWPNTPLSCLTSTFICTVNIETRFLFNTGTYYREVSSKARATLTSLHDRVEEKILYYLRFISTICIFYGVVAEHRCCCCTMAVAVCAYTIFLICTRRWHGQWYSILLYMTLHDNKLMCALICWIFSLLGDTASRLCPRLTARWMSLDLNSYFITQANQISFHIF